MASTIQLSVIVDRTDLGLADLDCNDHINYVVATQFMGGSVQWNRSQVTSPFIDGAVTVFRNKQQVQETIAIDVISTTDANTASKITALVKAFTQDTFNLQIAFGTSVLQYACEAADYTVGYAQERWAGRRVQVVFNVPRQPTPVRGGF